MSTQENGLAANTLAGLAAPVNIVSSTNANPIVVTATAHGLNTGDQVSINGHQVNTSANGTWTATRLSSNTYSIPVAGVGVGGATGTSQSLALGATFAIPSDGDAITAASVNVALEALADRTAFLGASLSEAKFIGLVRDGVDTDSFTAWDSFNVGTITNGAWNDLNSGTVFVPLGVSIQNGDLIDISLDISCNLSQTTAATFNGLSIFASITPPGGADSYAKVTASQVAVTVSQLTTNECHPVHLSGLMVAANAGALKIKLRGWPVDKTHMLVWTFIGSADCTARIYRPTGMPQ